MKPLDAKQISFLPGTNTVKSITFKKPPLELEKKFMKQLQDVAYKLGLPCLHIEYYCGNKFYVKCSKCGHPTLATCHKRNNTENVGQPDLIGIAWTIETKRDRNKRGDAEKTTPIQDLVMRLLKEAGIPGIVANPAKMQEAIDFLQKLAREKKAKGACRYGKTKCGNASVSCETCEPESYRVGSL